MKAARCTAQRRMRDHQRLPNCSRWVPVSRYSGEVRLTEVDGATELLWTGTLEPRIPGTGRILATVLGLAIAKIADRAIAIAERAADTAA
jgi:hypothetical protein